MTMTEDQFNVLAHVVVDPNQWLSHVAATFGQETVEIMLVEKVARWQPEYEAALASGNYKNRAERDAEGAEQ